ncbi:MAG TPA: alkaline phosphatase family protein [Gemmatimonadaceae bacterium]|jgi:hypothetical protein
MLTRVLPWGRAVAGALLMSVGLVGCDRLPTLPGGGGADRVKHVFVIVLENKNFEDTFGTSTQDPYLQKTLRPMGALLTQYYGTGHVSLDNYLSLVSGQAPTPDTDDDCIPGLTGTAGRFDDIQQTGTAAFGQVIAQHGCVYPTSVKTIADQMTGAHLKWRGYMGDMGNDPARENAVCGHPAVNGEDRTNSAEAPSATVPLGDAYATRHNPFVYFHSIIDSPDCAKNVVNLDQNLASDLSSYSKTPNLVFITPNLCDDGHDGDGTGAPGKGCADGRAGGLASADAFLQKWVPQILASPAYKQDGMLIITFDESGFTTSTVTSQNGNTTQTLVFNGAACCNQQPGPNLAGVRPGSFSIQASPTVTVSILINGFGGDRVGALLISPFVKPGATSNTQYNHYSMLKSLEQVFGITTYLGYANQPGLSSIADDTQIFGTH